MVTFWDLFAELILDTLVTKDSLPAFVVVLLYLLSITAVKLFVKETINHGFSYPSCITCLTLKIRKKQKHSSKLWGVKELSGNFFDNRNMLPTLSEWVWSLENDTFSTCRLVLSLFWMSRDMLGVDILMRIVVD